MVTGDFCLKRPATKLHLQVGMDSVWSLTTSSTMRYYPLTNGHNSADECLPPSPKSSSWYTYKSGWKKPYPNPAQLFFYEEVY